MAAGLEIFTSGGTVSILTVPVLFEPGAAPVFFNPSFAVHTRLCVPSRVMFNCAVADGVPMPDCDASAIDDPLSLQLIDETLAGSVTDTTTTTGDVLRFADFSTG